MFFSLYHKITYLPAVAPRCESTNRVTRLLKIFTISSSSASCVTLTHTLTLTLTLTLTMADPQGETTISVTLSKSGTVHPIILPSTALLTDLISASEDALLHSSPLSVYDWDKAKFIAAGTLLRSGPDDAKPIAHLHNKKVTLQVPTVEDIESIKHSSDAAKAREARRAAQRRAAVAPARTTRPDADKYGFLQIEPLPGLRNPERSRAFLERLAEDVGIRAAMRKHRFTGT